MSEKKISEKLQASQQAKQKIYDGVSLKEYKPISIKNYEGSTVVQLHPPVTRTYTHGTVSELGEWDLDRAFTKCTDGCVLLYWYTTAPYEGTGQALILHPTGIVGHTTMDHCSCYGPMGDDGYPFTNYESIQHFTDSLTEDHMKDVCNLISYALQCKLPE